MESNRAVYYRSRIVRKYAEEAAQGLTTPEEFCLELVPASSRSSVLDIGIGGGRTTGAISAQFERYVGVDYSAAMIGAAKNIHPGRDLRVMDARELKFGDGEFDCVVFSFNGIDSVGSYEDRHKIFKEIARVMKSGGYFIYSTKNIRYWKMSEWKDRFWHPAIFLSWKSPLRAIPNRLRNFWKQSIDEDLGIAFVNEQGHGFSFVHAYVEIEKELNKLKTYGLFSVETIGCLKSAAGYDKDDEWVYIIAQKH
ncbi:class I SAM-dependent methyltransferase [Devosia sp.]|uniref:class I SAM-dependent methyltransferase n=1 Tax=Devosia sp. TaxID=1871048 RepID=UPI003F70EAE8